MRTEIERLTEDYAVVRAAIEDAWDVILRRVREMRRIERALSKLKGELELDYE